MASFCAVRSEGFLLESVGQHGHSHNGLNTWMIGYMNLVQDVLGGVASARYRTGPFQMNTVFSEGNADRRRLLVYIHQPQEAKGLHCSWMQHFSLQQLQNFPLAHNSNCEDG